MTHSRFSRRFFQRLVACWFLGLTIYPLAVVSSEEPDPPPVPEDDEEMKPPGDCTKLVWRPLQKEVGRKCSTPGQKMECFNEDLCDHWCDAPRQLLEKYDFVLPYFSPSGRHFYLPAFLLDRLQELRKDSFDWVLRQLEPPEDMERFKREYEPIHRPRETPSVSSLSAYATKRFIKSATNGNSPGTSRKKHSSGTGRDRART